MSKFKLFHDCFEYVEGHEDEIFHVQQSTTYGQPKYAYGILVDGHMMVCPSCGGYGSHDRTDLDCSKLVDNMIEDGDTDGIEAYYNGAYSQPCRECKGKNVVLAPHNVPEWAMKEMLEWDKQAASDAAYEAQERAMGA